MKTKRLLFFFIFLLFFSLLIMLLLLITIRLNTKMYIRDYPEIKESGVLNVAIEYNSVDFYVVGDSVAGIQYDLCQYIAKNSGLTVQFFLENDLESAIQKLDNKEFDVIAQNIPITNKNNQFLAFTTPTALSKQVLIQRKRNEMDSVPFVSNQLELAGKTVFVTKNSPAILRLNNISEEIAEPIFIKEISGYTSEQLIYMVDKKEIDYAVVDKEISLKNSELFPDLDFTTDISFTQLQAWALRKTSPDLLDSLNVWIAAFKRNK